jgi:hypothetical protein
MLNRKTPDTLATDLTIKCQGDQFTVPVVFHNRRQSEIKAKNEELMARAKAEGHDDDWVNREQFMFVVKSFNGCDTPSHDDLTKLEDDYPGLSIQLFYKFHDLRRVEVVKN